eukprot:1141171-Pelagomonas_calceolata.AAC.3
MAHLPALTVMQGLGKAARPEANQESPGAGSDEQPQGQQTTSALHRVLKAVRRMAPLFVLAERFMHEEWPGLLHDAGVPSDTGGGLGGGAADVRVSVYVCACVPSVPIETAVEIRLIGWDAWISPDAETQHHAQQCKVSHGNQMELACGS